MPINSWTVSGNLGRDAESRQLQDGTTVVNFTVAGSSGYGERKKTEWADCVMFGKRGEAIARYLLKGTKVTVIGELSLAEFDRKDGSKGSKLSVRVAEIDLHGSKEGGEQRQSGGHGSRASAADVNKPLGNERSGAAGRGAGKTAFDQGLDDEIPF